MKYTNRLKARLAYDKLCESAKEGKDWIVTRKLILETDEGNMELDPGDTVEVGATDDGDMAIKGQAAVVVICDEDIAKKIADIIVNADELSDVEFVDRSALDALDDGEGMDQVIDDLADAEPAEGEDENNEPAEGEEEFKSEDTIEVPTVKATEKESVENKFAKFSDHRMNPEKFYICESILVDEESDDTLNMYAIKLPGMMKESFDNYKEFTKRVSELKGSIQPGKREIALTENGKVMGSYYVESDMGELYPENSFESVEEMDNSESDPAAVMDSADMDVNFDDEVIEDSVDECNNVNAMEACLKNYEESAKSGKDYIDMVNGLENLGLKESVVAKIVSSFDSRKLNECVRVYDSKYGKYVNALKESVEADNFIEETGEAKRFTKRFFN